MRGFVKVGVMGGGVTAGEGSEGLAEALPSASFPFSLYRGAEAKGNDRACNKNTPWRQRKSKGN